MKMKKLIIASAISILPVLMFGLIIPVVTLLSPDKKDFNEHILWIYVLFFIVGLSIIITTILSILKYSSKIDNFEIEEQKVYEKSKKLDKLISNYNELISKNQ